MSENRLKALSSFAVAAVTAAYLTPVSLMIGSTAPALTIAAALYYGIKKSNELNFINKINVI